MFKRQKSFRFLSFLFAVLFFLLLKRFKHWCRQKCIFFLPVTPCTLWAKNTYHIPALDQSQISDFEKIWWEKYNFLSTFHDLRIWETLNWMSMYDIIQKRESFWTKTWSIVLICTVLLVCLSSNWRYAPCLVGYRPPIWFSLDLVLCSVKHAYLWGVTWKLKPKDARRRSKMDSD